MTKDKIGFWKWLLGGLYNIIKWAWNDSRTIRLTLIWVLTMIGLLLFIIIFDPDTVLVDNNKHLVSLLIWSQLLIIAMSGLYDLYKWDIKNKEA